MTEFLKRKEVLKKIDEIDNSITSEYLGEIFLETFYKLLNQALETKGRTDLLEVSSIDEKSIDPCGSDYNWIDIDFVESEEEVLRIVKSIINDNVEEIIYSLARFDKARKDNLKAIR